MKNTISKVLLILIFPAFFSSSCGEDCVAAIADLTIEFGETTLEFSAGGEFDFVGLIPNIADVARKCRKEAEAGESIASIILEFSPNESGPFIPVNDEELPVPKILAEDRFEFESHIETQTAGFYKISLRSDTYNSVPESNEDNNEVTMTDEAQKALGVEYSFYYGQGKPYVQGEIPITKIEIIKTRVRSLSNQ